MLILLLAAAMTVAMLIATAFGVHQETENLRFREIRNRKNGFGPR